MRFCGAAVAFTKQNGTGIMVTAGGSAAALENGGTQIRTGDTTIFSRVLYQLSYPARATER